MLHTVLFDLDGTLTDSSEGICKGVSLALAHFGIEENDHNALLRFIGPPLSESFQKFYHLSLAQAKEATEVYRAYYIPEGVYANKPYDGVLPMLETLAAAGLDLVVATSKPWPLAETVLAEFSLAPYFSLVTGSEYDGTRAAKAEVIAHALYKTKANPEETAMVGDREHDIFGAKTHGLASIGVLYGFGGRAELSAAKADFLAETPQKVAEILLSLQNG